MRRTVLACVLLLFLPAFVFAPSLVLGCDYAQNGDGECDTENDLYCIDHACTTYAGRPEGTCADSDSGTAPYAGGSITHVFRTVDGAFMEAEQFDTCALSGSPIGSCDAGPDCGIHEYACIPEGGEPYSYVLHQCPDGCTDGACIDATAPTSWLSTGGTFSQSDYPGEITGGASDAQTGLGKVEVAIRRDSDSFYWNGTGWASGETWLLATGTDTWRYVIAFASFSEGAHTLFARATDASQNVQASPASATLTIVSSGALSCDYAQNGDGECDTENGYYCMDGACTLFATPPTPSCSDTDGSDAFAQGTVTYVYRSATGTVSSGSDSDYCTFGNAHEYTCLATPPASGKTYAEEDMPCAHGCENGACIPAPQGAVPDENVSGGTPQAGEVVSPVADGNGSAESDDTDQNATPPTAAPSAASPPALPAPDEAVTDEALLSFIDAWSQGALGATLAENDTAIQQVIAKWQSGK